MNDTTIWPALRDLPRSDSVAKRNDAPTKAHRQPYIYKCARTRAHSRTRTRASCAHVCAPARALTWLGSDHGVVRGRSRRGPPPITPWSPPDPLGRGPLLALFLALFSSCFLLMLAVCLHNRRRFGILGALSPIEEKRGIRNIEADRVGRLLPTLQFCLLSLVIDGFRVCIDRRYCLR